MRFSTFVKQSELIVSNLDNINTQASAIAATKPLFDISDQQKNKLKLFSANASQKYSTFEKILNKLFSPSTSTSTDDIDEEKVAGLQNKISDLYINITSITNSLVPPDPPEAIGVNNSNVSLLQQPAVANSSIKLPPLNLKTFSGQPEEWNSFQSLFENVIHSNESISNVEKFAYLLSCLTDEPLNLIKTLNINPANYQIAWQALLKRYQNSRLLITLHTNNILDLPQLSKPSTKQLRSFVSAYNENYEALKALGHDIAQESLLLTSHILRKFDSSLRTDFEHSRDDSKEVPTIGEVIKFLEQEASRQEAAGLSLISTENIRPTGSQKLNTGMGPSTLSKKKHVGVMLAHSSPLGYRPIENCNYCGVTQHSIYKCPDFAHITPQERHSFIKGKNLCQNCFGTHTLSSCKSSYSCKVCAKRHHTLLHFNRQEYSPQTNKPNMNNWSNGNVNSHTSHSRPMQNSASKGNSTTHSLMGLASTPRNSTVLLATTLIHVSCENGNSVVLRGVLDSASQTTLISENCANLLKVHRSFTDIPSLTGISSAQVKPKGLSFITLQSLSGHLLAKAHPVLILDKISDYLPRIQLSPKVKSDLKEYILADPCFDKPGPIDILVGADLFALTLLGPSISLGLNMPCVINTIFGHVVLGTAPIANPQQCFSGLTTLLSTNELDLHATLQRFWSLEEPPHSVKTSPQDEFCENHFMSTHSRDITGKYVCRLPFSASPESLGNSSSLAKRMFNSLEHKFETQPEFKRQYVEFMTDYKQAGHMKLCESSLSKPHFFLPHFGIFKDNKIRVVFNGSALTSTGVSLNSIQHSGPKLHNEILDIIFRFRQHKIVFTCDIKQMFRNIGIHEDDQIFQLIYWREDVSLPLQVFQLTTVTYGLGSSPFVANRVIRQLIADEGKDHPLAAEALQEQIYVDDVLLGSDSEPEAIALQQDVIGLLGKGHFELRKWSSNCATLLENVAKDCQEVPLLFRTASQPCHSILGLKWIPHTDDFSYIMNRPSGTSTKRSLLSTIAQIYDPIGLLAPLIFWAKALMQHVWSLGIDWDATLPAPISEKWSAFVKELPEIESLRIPRYISLAFATSIQLHGFSDASEIGFAACVYLRVEDSHKNVKIHLLIAKSRVAPLKRVTIPRLELCGAHMLAKLLQYCKEQLSKHYKITSIVAWCDSTVVLSWIRTPSYRLKLYVSNRVAQIQEAVPSCVWKHISSADNPADCASRGLTAAVLIRHSLWWSGPPWIIKEPESWPQSDFTPVSEESLPEVNSRSLNLMMATKDHDFDLLEKFSSWNTQVRVMAYVLKFIQNCKSKTRTNSSLSIPELEQAKNRIYFLVQMKHFKPEFDALKKNEPCSTRIRRLSPFIDSDGLIRVGGRLKNASIGYNAKHPLLLPKKDHTVNVLIDYYHNHYLHAGPQQMQSLLAQNYWILGARSIIRSRVFKCMRCFRINPPQNAPFMGELPEGRVLPSRPFSTSGCDYAGPFTVKLHQLRRLQPIKIYLCIFICFSTKAVHLETVTNLTTESFIATLTRFICRRGLVSHLYSDCGTQFIGASRQLLKEFKALFEHPDTRRFAEERSIKCHFIPPRAPHIGGLWERAVKSSKHHLKRVIGEQILTLEEFMTLTAKVEAMLNSRPLTQISTDPSELEALTPGHFLVGGPLVTPIEVDIQDHAINRLRRWQMVQYFGQHIWRRWQEEYLHTLQQRSKWTKKTENLQVGQLVVIHDSSSPPLTWKLGRIISTSPGTDGVVRVVTLKTQAGQLTRPVVKVSPLPTD